MVLCEEGLGLDDIVSAVVGAVPAARRLGRPARRQLLRGGERLRAGRCRDRRRRRRQRRDPVHLGHQRAAEGRGAELPRASVQRRADRRRLQPDRADRIYDFRSFNWCSAQTLSAVPPLCRGATLILGGNSRAAGSSITSGSTARPSRPAIRPPSASCSTARRLSAPDVPTLAFHDIELGAASGRRMAALRGALRHPRVARLRLQRDRLDRRAAGRAAAHRHGRPAARLSPAVDRRRRRTDADARRDRRGRARRLAGQRLSYARRRRLAPGRLPRPDEDRRSGLPRRRGLSAPHRPRQGSDHPRRRQHLAAGDRQCADAAARR